MTGADTRAAGRMPPAGIACMALALSVAALAPGPASAEVLVPPDEYVGYAGPGGAYTVVGNVKNGLDHGIEPTVHVRIMDGERVVSKTIRHVPLAPGAEAPFKARFHGIGEAPVLLPAGIEHAAVQKEAVPIRVLYDDTLVLHEDGHLTGRVINAGNHTVYNPKILAVIHGSGGVLDVARNMGQIAELGPGEIAEFAMYPDPAVAGKVSRYSCFAPVDTTVVPVTATKNGGDFDFRYDSGAWYYGAEFDESGTIMTINGYNSYPIETYANFELPPITGEEEFSVTLDGEPVDFVQSVDAMGFWHVAYVVEPRSQGVVRISGFGEGLPPELPRIPAWVRQGAGWWAGGQTPDSEFLEGVSFLLERGIIPEQGPADLRDAVLPPWFRSAAGWWADGQTTDDEFLEAVGWMIRHGIIGR